MTGHVFDPESAEKLEDPIRYRYLSRDELVGSLDPSPDDVVLDLGSGTGFFTRDVAGFVGTVYAVDLQPEMHEYFEDIGVPENVDLVTAEVGDMPFPDSSVDGAYATMTFHEFTSEKAHREILRVLEPGSRMVVVDWSPRGSGERGPPLESRYEPAGAAQRLEDSGFDVERVMSRPETFLIVVSAP